MFGKRWAWHLVAIQQTSCNIHSLLLFKLGLKEWGGTQQVKELKAKANEQHQEIEKYGFMNLWKGIINLAENLNVQVKPLKTKI